MQLKPLLAAGQRSNSVRCASRLHPDDSPPLSRGSGQPVKLQSAQKCAWAPTVLIVTFPDATSGIPRAQISVRCGGFPFLSNACTQIMGSSGRKAGLFPSSAAVRTGSVLPDKLSADVACDICES